MSRQLINRSPDLARLREDGYDIAVKAGHLLMHDVPYLDAQRQVRRGMLIDILNPVADGPVGKPKDHTLYFAGEAPCDLNGVAIDRIVADVGDHRLLTDLTANRRFSAKALNENGERQADQDYYGKFTRYVTILSGPAQAVDPNVTARTKPVILPDEDEDSAFNYIDSASSRAGIVVISQKLEPAKVAIIGLGGTGSYILDLVAKTPVREIHLYDPDTFSQHNAFRCPGAASIEDLKARQSKVAYLAQRYGKMRKFIIAHDLGVTTNNAHELTAFDFVFLSLDGGAAKRLAVTVLREAGVPFIECGMGLYTVNETVAGVLRSTTGARGHYDHLEKNIPFSDGDLNNDYARNIQIADLNALNAALAVIRWKKHFGFYNDLEHEHHCTYTVDGNVLSNSEQA